MEKNVVHVVGTGTVGSFREQLGIDEITFHKARRLSPTV
jgi:hypothetical protein